MKHIVAVNGSPRATWNTGTLVREVARGASEQGASIEVFDLYKLEPYTGCVSCFGCKLPGHEGRCVHKDGLTPVLEAIRAADGLVLGSPIYIGDMTAGFRALYERLIFQYITYKAEPSSYNTRKMPVVLVFTSNCPEAAYAKVGYDHLIENYKGLEFIFGSCQKLICSDTLQVDDYSKYDWTMFDVEHKIARREQVFPKDKQAAYDLGVQMVQ
jgi:multimeric flavodoxin WrbA